MREPIHREPGEVVRMAGVPNVVGRRRHSKPRSAPQTSASVSSSASDVRDTPSRQSLTPTDSVVRK